MMMHYSFIAAPTAKCECGTHASGITRYTVLGAEADCCSSLVAPGSVGFFDEYRMNSVGTWHLYQSTIIPALTAQSNCCTSS